jgi:hypothetical protein
MKALSESSMECIARKYAGSANRLETLAPANVRVNNRRSLEILVRVPGESDRGRAIFLVVDLLVRQVVVTCPGERARRLAVPRSRCAPRVIHACPSPSLPEPSATACSTGRLGRRASKGQRDRRRTRDMPRLSCPSTGMDASARTLSEPRNCGRCGRADRA